MQNLQICTGVYAEIFEKNQKTFGAGVTEVIFRCDLHHMRDQKIKTTIRNRSTQIKEVYFFIFK
tara:strand:+ start:176 stop:367 length:192 start_codon:yes stop_codon:yes gene_type:complete